MPAYETLTKVAQKAGMPDSAEPVLFIAVCDDGVVYMWAQPYALACGGVEGINELLSDVHRRMLEVIKRGTN